MIRLCAATLLTVGAVFGCSPVDDNSNALDAAQGAPDIAAPVITVSSPPQMCREVLVTQPITVSFDEPLDPASVSAATVTLGVDEVVWTYFFFDQDLSKPGGPVQVPLTNVRGSVTYEPVGNSITFKANQPLAYGMNYTLAINVKDTHGNTLDTRLPFTTFVNGITRQIAFRGTLVDRVFKYPVDANGYPDRRVRAAVGVDAMWFTSDDDVTQHIGLTFDAMGRPIEEAVMVGGNDGKLDTSDDTIAEMYSYNYDAEGKQHERVWAVGIGTDMMWNSPDDEIRYLMRYEYTSGRLSGYTGYTAPGTNNDWRAADAKCDSYWDYSYDEAGRKVREVMKKCGVDQTPRTSDDDFIRVLDYTYDANGELIETGLRGGPGTDQAWLTNDDVHLSITKLERDADGFVTQTFTSSGPGDAPVINRHTRNIYDPVTKLLVETTGYSGAGTDTAWGTDDDEINNYSKTSYDALGNRVDRKLYVLGSDAKPYTPDDQVALDDDFDLAN